MSGAPGATSTTARTGAMSRVQKTPVFWLFLALALVPFVAKFGAAGYIMSLLTRALILAIAALSLDLILGYGALASFGHAAFLGIGSYAVGMLSAHGVDELMWQLAVAMIVATAFAAATSAISLRASGVYYIMSTLAFGQMLYFFAVSLSAYGGDDGMTLPARSRLFGVRLLATDVGFYYIVLGILIGFYLLATRIVASRFGRVLGGIRENPQRMRAIGFEPFGYQLTACVIAGAMAATAGVLLANQAEFVSPAYMTWQRSGELLVMVILGGMGTLWGAIVGALAFVLLEEVLSGLTEQWKLIMGPLLVIVALAGKGGVAGLFQRTFKRGSAP
jgi:branched-chain amino acid transport system permease protein